MDDGRDELHVGIPRPIRGGRTSRHSIELVVQPPTRSAERLTQVHQVKCRAPYSPTPMNTSAVARTWAGCCRGLGTASPSNNLCEIETPPRGLIGRAPEGRPGRWAGLHHATCPPGGRTKAREEEATL